MTNKEFFETDKFDFSKGFEEGLGIIEKEATTDLAQLFTEAIKKKDTLFEQYQYILENATKAQLKFMLFKEVKTAFEKIDPLIELKKRVSIILKNIKPNSNNHSNI